MGTKTAIITGGGIGIGRSSAFAFAEDGYRVIVTDILEAEGRRVVAELQAKGADAEFHALDVRDTEQTNRVIAAVEAKHGPLDVVLANAGIAHKVPLAQLTDEKWSHTLDIDLGGVMRIIRAAAPAMRKNGQGSVIALSSIMGVAYGWDEHVHYSAAKAGVVGLVRGSRSSLAATACGSMVSHQVISAPPKPFPMSTLSAPPVSRLQPASSRSAASVNPRMSPTSHCSLPPRAARYISGQVIVVDGGLLVGRY